MVEAQGGDASALDDPAARDGYTPAAEVPAPADAHGYVAGLDALALGWAAVDLGAGRRVMTDRVDPIAGLVLLKKPGEAVAAGEPLARIYTKKSADLDEAARAVQAAFTFAADAPAPASRLLDRYTAEGWASE